MEEHSVARPGEEAVQEGAPSSCKALARPTQLAQLTFFLPLAPGGPNRNTGGFRR